MSSTFPDLSRFRMIACRERLLDNIASVEDLIEYNGIKYQTLLVPNMDLADCEENKCLRRIYDLITSEESDGSDSDSQISSESATPISLELFWPFIRQHQYGLLHEKDLGSAKAIGEKQSSLVRIQVKTINGVLQAVSHQRPRCGLPTSPIQNPFPEIPLFKGSRVERRAEIGQGVFRVQVNGGECVLKTIQGTRASSFLRELKTLRNLPRHPNLNRLIGVMDAGDGKIDGILTGYIPGNELAEVKCASHGQKSKWKQDILSSVHLLHSRNLVWGDVKPHNIIISSETGSVVLIDFGGGWTRNWVDEDLCDSTAGDLQGVQRLFRFIDRIATA